MTAFPARWAWGRPWPSRSVDAGRSPCWRQGQARGGRDGTAMAVIQACCAGNAVISLALHRCALEQLDALARGELDDRLLPGARSAAVQPAPLRLGLHLRGANGLHVDVEDLLDGLGDLKLVGPVVDPERVLALRHQGVALLRDDGADDHLARLHQSDPPCPRACVGARRVTGPSP